MVSFSRMSVEELRAYNRDAQKRSRARTSDPEHAEPKRIGRSGGRPAGTGKRELVDETGEIGGAEVRSTARPSTEMLKDAWRRNCAPRSITAWVCGDPPPGRSALDRRCC